MIKFWTENEAEGRRPDGGRKRKIGVTPQFFSVSHEKKKTDHVQISKISVDKKTVPTETRPRRLHVTYTTRQLVLVSVSERRQRRRQQRQQRGPVGRNEGGKYREKNTTAPTGDGPGPTGTVGGRAGGSFDRRSMRRKSDNNPTVVAAAAATDGTQYTMHATCISPSKSASHENK